MGIKNDKGRALKILKILLVEFNLKSRATISLPVLQGYCISHHCLLSNTAIADHLIQTIQIVVLENETKKSLN